MGKNETTIAEARTNGREFAFSQGYPLALPFGYRLRKKLRSFLKRLRPQDDFAWDSYHVHYNAEIDQNKLFYTEDLKQIDFQLINGRLYILGDCKPVHFTWRCVYEAIYNLPAVSSICEVGVGGGRFIANLQTILGAQIRFSGYDISEKQLLFFKKEYPEEYRRTVTGVLDLTLDSVPQSPKPDVVLVSTVLMHIQRPGPYQSALKNLVNSAGKYVVIMDNYNAHDYFEDLKAVVGAERLYIYDSGANIAIVIDLSEDGLDQPYSKFTDGSMLVKYNK